MKQHLMIRDSNIRVEKRFAYFPTTIFGEKMLPKGTAWWIQYYCVKRVSSLTGDIEYLGNFETEQEILELNPTLWNKNEFPNQECFWFLTAGVYTCSIPKETIVIQES